MRRLTATVISLGCLSATLLTTPTAGAVSIHTPPKSCDSSFTILGTAKIKAKSGRSLGVARLAHKVDAQGVQTFCFDAKLKKAYRGYNSYVKASLTQIPLTMENGQTSASVDAVAASQYALICTPSVALSGDRWVGKIIVDPDRGKKGKAVLSYTP